MTPSPAPGPPADPAAAVHSSPTNALEHADKPIRADEVSALVLAVPGVVRLHGGSFGEVATYLPGRRVQGVSLREDRCEVHVVVHPDADILATAAAVRASVLRLVEGRVDIYVEDLATELATELGTELGTELTTDLSAERGR